MESGAKLRVYDPKAMKECLRIYGEKDDLFYAKNQYEALHKADALIVMTEWNEFRSLDLNQLTNLMKDKVIFDGRNIYDPHEIEESGFTYYGIGRGKKIY